jgi:uncharacterized protein (DUF3820 family)
MDFKPWPREATEWAFATTTPASEERKAEPYHLDFGMHQGKLLAEVPPDYVEWIVKENIAAGKLNLKEALALYNFPAEVLHVKKKPNKTME